MPRDYGIIADLKEKIAAKRDPDLEKDVLKWIFGFLGEPVPEQALEDAFHDGTVLLRFIKKVQPDLVPYAVQEGKNEAKTRENIGLFVAACAKLGVRGTDIFQTVDLYEKKDIPQVTVSLIALGTELQRSHPEVPAFGPAPKH